MRQPARESVSAAQSFVQATITLLSMNALGGLGATDSGHTRKRKQMTVDGEGDEIQDGGMERRDEEAGVVLFTSRHASGLRVR